MLNCQKMSAQQAGLPKTHHSSADLSSAASSEFEEVRLEELGLHAGEIADWQAARAAARSLQGKQILSKVKEDAGSEQAPRPASVSEQEAGILHLGWSVARLGCCRHLLETEAEGIHLSCL